MRILGKRFENGTICIALLATVNLPLSLLRRRRGLVRMRGGHEEFAGVVAGVVDVVVHALRRVVGVEDGAVIA